MLQENPQGRKALQKPRGRGIVYRERKGEAMDRMEFFDFDVEPPDPPVDEHVTVRCEECEETWHPTVEYEWQGIPEMGGMVAFYTEDAFDCPSCGQAGEEVEDG
jgi:hypothetical protein